MCTDKISPQSLHTGIGVVDSQHQTFFALLKKVRECDSNTNPSDLTAIIDELHLYTLYHFETEEKILEEHNLPTIEEHKAIHMRLVDKIDEFRLENILDSASLATTLADYMEKWLIHHIQKVDMEDLKIVPGRY